MDDAINGYVSRVDAEQLDLTRNKTPLVFATQLGSFVSNSSLKKLRTKFEIFKKVASKIGEHDTSNDIYGPLLTKTLCEICLELDEKTKEDGESPRLTLLHSICLKAAIGSKTLLVVKPIVDNEYDGPESKLITKSAIVSFHLYRATVLIQRRQFKPAYQSLNICMNIPHKNSDLHIKCLKLYALTSILIDPRFEVPLGERKDSAERSCTEYLRFARSGSNINGMLSGLAASKETFSKDGLYGVAVMCVEEKLLRVIQSLSSVYVSIRVDDIQQLPELKGFDSTAKAEIDFGRVDEEVDDREARREKERIREKDVIEDAESRFNNSSASSSKNTVGLESPERKHSIGGHSPASPVISTNVDRVTIFGDLSLEIQKFLFAGRLSGAIKQSSEPTLDVLIFKQDRKSVATYVNRLESLLAHAASITKALTAAGNDIVYLPEFARKVKFMNKRGLEDSKITIREDILYINASQRRKLSREDNESSDDDRMTDE
jgi:hypothetical protein